MASETTLTDEVVTNKIKLHLGHPMICVELHDPDHYDEIIRTAKRWWMAKKGGVKSFEATISGSQTEIPLPDDADVPIDVIFSGGKLDSILSGQLAALDLSGFPADLYIGGPGYTGGPGFTGAGGFYSGLVQALQHHEEARHVLGIENDWDWDYHRRVVITYPSNRNGANNTQASSKVIIFYKTCVFDYSLLTLNDTTLFLRYAYAVSKEFLGRIRSKYQQWPTAAGPQSMDGEALLQEAAEAKEALNREIRQTHAYKFITA